MSELILPDSRLEMPALLYPGRKPEGAVRFNFENRIAKRFCHWSHISNGSIKDLVTGATPVLKSAIDFVLTEKGFATKHIANNSNFVYKNTDFPQFTTNVGVYFRLQMLSSSSSDPGGTQNWFFNSTDNQSGMRIYAWNAGVPRFRLSASGSSVFVDVSGTWALNEFVDFFFRYDGSKAEVLINGVVINSKNKTGDYTNYTNDWSIGCDLSNTGAAYANVINFGVCDKYMSDYDIKDLCRDPYQVLIPA